MLNFGSVTTCIPGGIFLIFQIFPSPFHLFVVSDIAQDAFQVAIVGSLFGSKKKLVP